MKSNKPQSPSKDELLSELESIKNFLDDEEVDDAAIPTLTAIAEDGYNNMDTVTHEAPPVLNQTVQEEEALRTAYSSELISEPPKSEPAEQGPASKSEKFEQQGSLFAPEEQDVSQAYTKPKDTPIKDEVAMPKARGDNPFLPPHIRERLGRHKELFESMPEEIVKAMAKKGKVDLQGDLLNGFDFTSELLPGAKLKDSVSESGTTEPQVFDYQKEALIDEIVAEYLPLIEAKLRAKLRSTSFKDTK